MKKIMLFLIGLIAFVAAGTAQEKAAVKQKKCACSFQSYNQVGLLEGEHGSAFQLQTINGLRYKTWFAGIGLGLDYYKSRSIPLFLYVRKDILNRKKTPFIYADGGISFTWGKNSVYDNGYETKYQNGAFYETGIGYKFGLKNNTALLFSAGYSFKSARESKYGILYCPFLGPCKEGLIERIDYKLNRLSLKAGLTF